MISYIKNQIKRSNVKTRKKRKAFEVKSAMKTMNFEQKEVFDLVVEKAKKYPESIRYDIIDKETLIVLKDLIITIKRDQNDFKVFIDNHKGFHPQWFYEAAFELLNAIVDIEAHRYRRGLKHETRMNIRSFLKSIREPDEQTTL